MPCVATLEYSKSELIKTKNISTVDDFYEISGSLDSEWKLSLDYNHKTCPYKLARVEMLPFEDWSLKCQIDNTCVTENISI